jgi:hypothetical protein
MHWEERIAIDPEVLTGKPVIKGTRLAVEFVVGLLAEGWSEAEIVRTTPGSNKMTSGPASATPTIASGTSASSR